MQLTLAGLISMLLIALLVDHFSETVDLRFSILGYIPFLQQILFGLGAGIIIAILIRLVITTPLLNPVNLHYANMLGRFNLNTSEIIFVSFCAGVSEEIFFRGALQPLLGIIATAILFVAIHGYIKPSDWRLSLYGLLTIFNMTVIGYMANTFGLISAILAHTIIDIYLFYHLQRTALTIPISENQKLPNDFEEENEEEF